MSSTWAQIGQIFRREDRVHPEIDIKKMRGVDLTDYGHRHTAVTNYYLHNLHSISIL